MPVSAPGPETRVYQPGELNQEVRLHLEAGFPRLWLSGEISNLAKPASGHWYFTLKDARAQIRCALFRGQRSNVEGQPGNGDQVLVRGRLSLFEPRGDYQLVADALLPAGAGALQQAFEALKTRLEREGLFDPARRKPLPTHPGRIAVVTSPSGAAIRDILTTLQRRWPSARVRVYASPVQGEQAAPALIRALHAADRHGFDAIVLARGGGSLEDLWAFNDESLARAIATLDTPLVCGVGHETDFTIADFVADQRAATPTAAAEAITPDGPALKRQLGLLDERLERAQSRILQRAWQTLDGLTRRLAGQHPTRRLGELSSRLDALQSRLCRAARVEHNRRSERLKSILARLHARHPGPILKRLQQRRTELGQRMHRAIRVALERKQARFVEHARALNAVSPLAVVARGYALVENADGRVLSQRSDFAPGQKIRARVRDFVVHSTVDKIASTHEPPDEAESEPPKPAT